MINRRDFLQGIGAACAATSLLGPTAGAAKRPPAAGRPRALISILITGGIDAIQTSDPKAREEVSSRVHRGYEDRDIIPVRGSQARVGPLLRRLAPRLTSDMAIVNGVNVATVAHLMGCAQYVDMRRLSPRPTASLLGEFSPRGLLGTLASLDPASAPLSQVVFTSANTSVRPPGGLVCDPSVPGDGITILSRLWELAQDGPRRTAVRDTLQKHLERCGSTLDCTVDRTVVELTEALARIARFPELPTLPVTFDRTEQAAVGKMSPKDAKDLAEGAKEWQPIIRDTIFLLEHGLSRFIYIVAPQNFDTHLFNDTDQAANSAYFFTAISVLLDRLKTVRGTDGRPLEESVGVLMASELGRHPYLNHFAGKDHFPEVPVFWIGPGVRPGVYGHTNDVMLSQPISPSTGAAASGAEAFLPDLDDIGATVIDWFGHDPIAAGYSGRRLGFLLREASRSTAAE